MIETYHAAVTGVYAEDLGDQLVADTPIGDGILNVRDVADFDEDGGWLLLNGTVLEYDTVDDDTSAIILTLPLVAAAATDDVVTVWDAPNAQKATVYKAVVDQIDGFDGVATAVIQQSVAHALAQNMRDGTGESATLTRDDDNELQLVAVHGRAFALAALQYMQGGMTTRSAEDQPGIDILGADSGIPGVYLYGANGNRIVLRDDGSEGIVEFWAGIANEIKGFINPQYDAATGRAYIDFKTSSDPTHAPAWLRMYGEGATAPNVSIMSGTELWAFVIHSLSGGIFMEDLAGGGSTGADISNLGRIVRTTSSRRYKSNIKPLRLAEAQKVLDLEPVTFTRRDEAKAENRRTYAGFIAEQAAEVGAELWVNRDADDQPDGFRYAELAAALIPIIRDQQQQIDALAARLERLEAKE